MTLFKVAFLYDGKTKERHRPFISDAVQAAGGRLLPDDVWSGSSDIVGAVEHRIREADVVIIDVTTESTDIGYELGYYLRPEDLRLIFVTFAPGPSQAEKIHFYLRQRHVLDLSDLLTGSGQAPAQRERFVSAIAETGKRQSKNPIPQYPVFPRNDSEAESLLSDNDVILRAPGAGFVFGEFAVTIGHPALHLPIPRYVYVGLRRLPANRSSRIAHMSTGPRGETERHELITQYRDPVVSAFERMLPGHRPIEITVCSQVPTMCGLGTSSALAACLAIYAARRNDILTRDEYLIPDEAVRGSGNLLQQGGLLDQVFRLGWLIDLAFHSPRGSGAGTFASLVGTHGPNPVIFLSAARKLWAGDHGTHPWDLAEAGLETEIKRIPCFGYRAELHPGEVASKPWHFAFVYTGEDKQTGWAMSNLESMSRYFVDRSGALLQIVNSLRDAHAAGTELRQSVNIRLSEQYRTLLEHAQTGDSGVREATLSDHVRVSLMTLLEGYGNTTMAGINSYWSVEDDRFLALMEACQAILESMSIAQIQHGSKSLSEPARLAHALNSARDENGRRIFGAKITGGGTGGDLIVMSNIKDGDTFERHLRQVLADARYDCQSSLSEYAKVHFSSTWVENFPGGYVVEGARLIRGD